MPEEFDYVVVGAGIVGSWTAKELVNHGKVLLLEQFPELHTRGSSHGQSRIIRSGYSEPFFAEMMPHAFQMWNQAMEETDEQLIEKTGILCIANSRDNKEFLDCVENMKKICPENLMELSADYIKGRHSKTLNYPENIGLLLDVSGGVVFAHKSVQTIQKWFKKSGGTMWDSCKVTKIEPLSTDKVRISCSRGDIDARSVVVCAGPWTKDLLQDIAPSLPLQPKVTKVYYWKEKEIGAYSASSMFPALLDFNHPNVYALPSLEYPGLVKICVHGGVPATPDERDKAPRSTELQNLLEDYVREHFPLIEPEPAIIETCMYTCTPDEIFIIDTLPGHKNIVVGAGFSGTGFKTSPVVGRLLSELARGEVPFLNLAPYRVSRFTS